MTELIVHNIQKTLGHLQILKGASFKTETGRILALLGASGSGKTTLLRCVAGLEQPEGGRIQIGDTIVLDSDRDISLSPEQRNMGLVFQSYALWPHKTVLENVAYGLRLRGLSKEQANEKVQTILARMGLGHLSERYPDQLSGGQQQRVAICRALVYEPRVLLMDEPLSNLDAKLREEARYWIRKLILDLQICAILVTHDQTEALAVADHILLLKDGVIVQEGSPIDIYSNPKTFYAADFLGTNNILRGKLQAGANGEVKVRGDGWELDGTRKSEAALGADVDAVIRVEQISVVDGAGPNRLEMDLEACIYLGDKWEYRVARGDLKAKVHGHKIIDKPIIWCEFPAESLWIFGKE